MTKRGDAIETRPHHTRMPRFERTDAGRTFDRVGHRFAAVAVVAASAVAGMALLPF